METQISKFSLLLIGILGWAFYSIIENLISVFCVEKYPAYYLLSCGLWLFLGLLASLALYGLAMLLSHILRLGQMAPVLALVFFALAPACFYFLIHLSNNLPGKYFSPPNILADGFTLLVFSFISIYLYKTWKRRRISLFDSVACHLLFGGFGIIGVLLAIYELQSWNWRFKVGLVFLFCVIMPFLLILLFNKTAPIRKCIYVLDILLFSIILETKYFFPFIHDQAFAQEKAVKNEVPRVQENATNVVLIVVDTLRAKNMSLYGYKRNTTPNLDLFARDAVKFTDAISSAPWTLPSHASLFTGYLSHIHGADHGTDMEIPGFPLSEGFDTLAELMRSAGYQTAAVVANHSILAPWGA